MSGIVGVQDVWVTGSRFFFIRDDDTNGAALDLGTIETASPNIETEDAELYDGECGTRKKIAETTTQIDESYSVVCNNFATDNLAILFHADPPSTYTQPSGGDISAVAHTAVVGAGKYVKLKDANGVYLYSLASATITGSGGAPSYTEDTDWQWVSLERGIIEIISGGSITDGLALEITMTLNALTGDRLVLPHTVAGGIGGKAFLFWGRNDCERQTVREFDARLKNESADLSVEAYSSWTFNAQVLSDLTQTTMPAGRVLNWLGALPAGP